ncbi:MAG: hypothetical protein POELPBGB_03616 [Bacteroidia bacterium]|nr:hypothetical protein [Bacteroidia bacterium]
MKKLFYFFGFILCFITWSAKATELISYGTRYVTDPSPTSPDQVLSDLTCSGCSTLVWDDNIDFYWATSGSDLQYYSVKSGIELGIDWESDYFSGDDFGVELTADITYWDKNSTTFPSGGSTLQCTLRVVYDRSTGATVKSVDNFVFSQGLKFKLSNVVLTYYDASFGSTLSISPENVYVTTFIIAEQYRDITNNPAPEIDDIWVTASTTDRNTVSWTPDVEAEEYDLEWTYINANDNSDWYNFKRNSTRIRTKATSYQIPNIYEEGIVLVRYRVVGRNFNDPSEITFGQWSIEFDEGDLSDLLDDLNGGTCTDYCSYFTISATTQLPHEQNKNWQYSMSFAEEGKTKEVISYFDGTLRKRQTVARNNTDTKAIVANTIYDSQGRPAIESLPVPDMAEDETNLDYHELFTQSATSVAYDFNNFDLDASDCVSATDPLLNTAGPGLYYSDNNPDQSYENAFIPDAEQYPFVQTEYTPDNTGRIRRKSGAGADHVLGSGHETQYLYALPLQEQLDRLFANDVGYANHYTKEMVIDPNGTISVTYKNASGKVIATALAGDPEQTPGLIPLESSENALQAQHANLMNYAQEPQDGLLTVAYTHVVSKPDMHEFHYDVTRETFETECLPEGICFDCVYELVLSIKDECNVELVPPSLSVFTLGEPELDCDESGELTFDLDDEVPGPLSIDLPEVGSYTITKTLRVSTDASRYYLEQYLDTAECLTPFSEFSSTAVSNLDFSGCGISCEECLEQLGVYADYENEEWGDPSSPSYVQGYVYLTEEEYEAAQAQCQALCTGGVSPCDAYKILMLADMSPGGQYAPFQYADDPDNTDETWDAPEFAGVNTGDTRSYFHDDPVEGMISFSEALDAILDWYVAESIVPPVFMINGVETSISELTQQEYADVFIDQWAEILLPFHPEYCYYDFCLDNEPSYEYDRNFANTMSFAEANTAGYMNPLNESEHYPPFAYNCGTTGDPFFIDIETCNPNDFWNEMEEEMDDYPFYLNDLPTQPDASIWTLAAMTQMQDSEGELCISNDYWQIFKGLYQALKQKALRDAMIAMTCSTNVYTNPASFTFTDKERRFLLTLDDMYAEGEITDHVNQLNTQLNENPPDEEAVTTYLNGLMDSHYQTQCDGYADGWLQTVLPCKPEAWDEPAWLANTTALRTQLIEICTFGSDVNNPFGASSTTQETSSGFQTFEDALAGFINQYQIDITATCNPNIINFPQPQGHSYFSGEGGSAALDDCACDTILAAHNAFLAFGSSLPEGICTEAQYFTSVGINATFDIDLGLKYCGENVVTTNSTPNTGMQCGEITEVFYDFLAVENLPPYPTSTYSTINIYDFTAHANTLLGESFYWFDYYSTLAVCLNTPTTTANIPDIEFIEFTATFFNGGVVTDPGLIDDFTTAANDFFDESYTDVQYLMKLREIRDEYVKISYVPDYKILTGIEKFLHSLAGDELLMSHTAVNVTDNPDMDFYKELFNIDPGCEIWYKSEDFYQGVVHDSAVAAYTIQPNATDSITFTWTYPLDYYAGEKLTLRTSAWSDQALSDVTFAFTAVENGSFSGSNSFTENLTANVTSSHNVTVLTEDVQDSLVFHLFARAYVNSAWDTIDVRIALPNLNYSADNHHYSEDLYITFIDSCAATTIHEQCLQLAKPDSIAWEDITGFAGVSFEGEIEKNESTPSHIAKLRDDMQPYFTISALVGEDTITLYAGSRGIPVATEKSNDFTLPGLQVPSAITCNQCGECNELLQLWVQFSQLNPAYNLFADETLPIFDMAYAPAFTNYVNSTTNNNVQVTTLLEMAQNCFATQTDVIDESAPDVIELLNAIMVEAADEYNSPVALDVSPFSSQLGLLEYTNTPSTCHPQMDFLSVSNTYIDEFSLQASFIMMTLSDECDVNQTYVLLFDPAVNPADVVSIGEIIDPLETGDHYDNDPYIMRVTLQLTGTETIAGILLTPIDIAHSVLDTALLSSICPGPLVPEVPAGDNCVDYLMDIAQSNATLAYNSYINEISNQFLSNYVNNCMQAQEHFTMDYEESEYHYTLYYYDQAGNLVKTVPPQGVKYIDLDAIVSGSTTVQDVINSYRNGTSGIRVNPQHIFNSTYVLNTLNQVTTEITPDAGTKRIWYDRLGRPVLSQTAEQFNDNALTHTSYDELGRPKQVEKVTFIGGNPTNWPPTAADTWDEDALSSWAYSGTGEPDATEIVVTVYDEPVLNIPGFVQENLRGRVSSVVRNEMGFNFPDVRYDFATNYSYDIHGNVKTIVHDIPVLIPFGNRYFRIDYEYDLVSGNVKQVWYQRGKADQFTHKYTYDADNRLAKVFTSTDGIIWHNDAEYDYYMHGPLARTALGDIKVQGSDYAYTIQGWMKAVNAASLNSSRDMGLDGETHLSAKDAMGFNLGYYNGDYTGIGGSSFEPVIAGTTYEGAILDDGLFNGNITRMATALLNTDRDPMPVAGNAYHYDQLNRIKEKTAFLNPDMHLATGTGANTWSGIDPATEYYEDFSYDANGNIYNLTRNGESGNTAMDDMDYYYIAYDENDDPLYYKFNSSGIPVNESSTDLSGDIVRYTNQLAYVNDAVTTYTGTSEDIEDQAAGNYTYDLDGNLLTDDAGNIAGIDWNNYGKIEGINFENDDHIGFAYDCQHNRIAKLSIINEVPKLTFYIRDAQGNVLSTYNIEVDGLIYSNHLKEQMLYGSSRLGLLSRDVNTGETEDADFTTWASNPESAIVFENVFYDPENPPTETPVDDPFADDGHDEYIPKVYGNKRYELSNHLGNVLSVITDRKVPVEDGTSNTVDYHEPWVLSENDYYAFGSLMPGRHEESDEYRFGFQAQEKDDEISGEGNSISFKYRVEDTRLGRFLSIDPLAQKYPKWSPYAFSGNQVVHTFELEGLEPWADLNRYEIDLEQRDHERYSRINEIASEPSIKQPISKEIQFATSVSVLPSLGAVVRLGYVASSASLYPLKYGGQDAKLLGSWARNQFVKGARLLTPEPFTTLASDMKPTTILNPEGRFWSTNYKTNLKMGSLGLITLPITAYGIHQSVERVDNAPNEYKDLVKAQETGYWTGTLAGTYTGGKIGLALGGPIGAFGLGTLGGALGGAVGAGMMTPNGDKGPIDDGTSKKDNTSVGTGNGF